MTLHSRLRALLRPGFAAFPAIVAMAATAGLATSANATVTTISGLSMYTTQAEFQAALAALGETANLDNFDTLGSSLGGSITRAAGDIGYTASSIKYDTGAVDTLARTGTGPDYALTTGTVKAKRGETYPGDILQFSDFSGGVNAAGVTVSELGSSTIQLGVYGENDDIGLGHVFTIAPGTNFVGFISATEPLDDLQVYARLYPAGVEPVVTGLYLAAPAAISDVPEPASWAMLVAGFGLTGSAMRARRKSAVSLRVA